MKRILTFFFLVLSIYVCAQDNADDTIPKKMITAEGKPSGKKTELKIEKSGDTLVSSDRKLKLIIPEGAVTKKTNFSIQPVTNLMINGVGKAYKLEPSGKKFDKPLQLIFSYDGEEIKDTLQLLLGIGMQDEKGQWYGLNKFTLDTVAKTISGDINHFSTWANYESLRIEPSFSKVKINKTLRLYYRGVEFSPPTGGEDDDLLSALSVQPKRAVWRVDNIKKGNAIVGTLNFGESAFAEGGNMYTAPAAVPDRNPVAVSVQLTGMQFKFNGIVFKDLRLVSNLLIYDKAYEIVYTNSYADEQVTVYDTASFFLVLDGKKSKVEEIYNSPYYNEFKSDGACAYYWRNANTCTGFIHLVGASSISITPSGNSRRVEVLFTPFTAILPKVTHICRGVRIDRPAFPFLSFPQRIQFIDNGEKQEFIDLQRGLFGKDGFKISINPVRESASN